MNLKLEQLSLRDRVLHLFSLTGGALTQKSFEKELNDVPLTHILPILNTLQKEGLLDVLVNADRTLSWQLRDQSDSAVLKSLTDLEERLVYNAVRKAGEDAASLKSISVDTKVQQSRVSRILKNLVSKHMIKELRMSTGPKNKVYLLVDQLPSEKIAASTLFAGDSGVDGEFIAVLRSACLKYLQDKTMAASHIADPLERRKASYVSVEEIHRFISNAKICTVSMTVPDVKSVLDALQYAGDLESQLSVQQVMASQDDPTLNTIYRLASPCTTMAGLSRIPCTLCLCRKDCHQGGPINPGTCQLLDAFLEF